MGKVVLYMAISEDGFIADENGGVDWLPEPTSDVGDAFGYQKLMDRIGSIVMGSRSYEQALGFGEWAWGGKQTYVFTSRDLRSNRDEITIVAEGVSPFMSKLKQEKPDQDIWLFGGAELAHSFAKEGLIDEAILTLIPKKLENGIFLDFPYDEFSVEEEKPPIDGMIQRVYCKNESGVHFS